MLVRIEHWLTATDRAVFKRTLAPALQVAESTPLPVELPAFNGARHVLHVRALAGSTFVQIGHEESVESYDPAAFGHLLLEGENERFLVQPGSYIMIQEWNGTLR
jgi:hypothetical protein